MPTEKRGDYNVESQSLEMVKNKHKNWPHATFHSTNFTKLHDQWSKTKSKQYNITISAMSIQKLHCNISKQHYNNKKKTLDATSKKANATK